MKIGVDLDGVVFDSEKTFRTYEDIYDILYLGGNTIVDKSEPKHQARFNWNKQQENEFRKLFYLKVSKESGLMSGFLAVYQLLKKQGHEFIVITARGASVAEMQGDAERILAKNNIKFNKYYWKVEDKLDICKKEKVDYMIDDDWRIIETLANNGVKTLYFRDVGLKKLHENKYIKEVNGWGDIFRFFYNLK